MLPHPGHEHRAVHDEHDVLVQIDIQCSNPHSSAARIRGKGLGWGGGGGGEARRGWGGARRGQDSGEQIRVLLLVDGSVVFVDLCVGLLDIVVDEVVHD